MRFQRYLEKNISPLNLKRLIPLLLGETFFNTPLPCPGVRFIIVSCMFHLTACRSKIRCLRPNKSMGNKFPHSQLSLNIPLRLAVNLPRTSDGFHKTLPDEGLLIFIQNYDNEITNILLITLQTGIDKTVNYFRQRKGPFVPKSRFSPLSSNFLLSVFLLFTLQNILG